MSEIHRPGVFDARADAVADHTTRVESDGREHEARRYAPHDFSADDIAHKTAHVVRAFVGVCGHAHLLGCHRDAVFDRARVHISHKSADIAVRRARSPHHRAIDDVRQRVRLIVKPTRDTADVAHAFDLHLLRA